MIAELNKWNKELIFVVNLYCLIILYDKINNPVVTSRKLGGSVSMK